MPSSIAVTSPEPRGLESPPPAEHPTYSAGVRAATIPVLFGIGALVSVQSKINSELAGQLGTGLRAAALSAVISFGVGLVLLTVVVLSHGASRRGVARLYGGVRRGELPLGLVIGGLAGAAFVASQGIAVGTLGVALFIVAVVAGQSAAGLLVDHHGIGPGGPRPVSRARLAGAALAMVAVIVSALGSGAALVGGAAIAIALLPLLAGMGTSLQQGLNGRVAVYAGSWATTFNNFVIGLGVLGVYFAVSLLVPGQLTGLPSTPWLYLGGAIGVIFIWASSIMVRIHGVLILGLCAIAGQVVSAILIDLITAPGELGPLSYVSAVITLAGVLVATVFRSRR